MRTMRVILSLAGALAMAACSSSGPSGSSISDISSRGNGDMMALAAQPAMAGDLKVVDFQMVVPSELRVSESSSFYPMFTDIVWRGDPIGDRRSQITAMFQEAASRAIATDTGGRAVVAEAELERFHGVTEATRFTVGGVYNIRFWLTYRDAATGEQIGQPELVTANLGAPGGRAAMALESAGQTEKVRVTDFLAETFHERFALPVGAAI